jgi:uncharacterized protein (DUF2235 family)
MGEAFIQRITGQASTAGNSVDPPADFVLCIDGTGNDMLNEAEVKNTNVAKITDLIEYGKHEDRITIVAYQQGLGNKSRSSKRDNKGLFANWASRLEPSFMDELWPSVSTITKLVSINYSYISMSVNPEKDRVFLFGFSRGAYVSQITAALVADLGIISNKIYTEKFANVEYSSIVRKLVKAWVKGQGRNSETIKKALGRYCECLIPAKIQFLGLFDTVASVGKPDLAFANLQNSTFGFAESVHNRPNILNAYHAVAISEHRNQFKPVLWKEGTTDKNRNISQVWFPGFHTSIGGGTKTQGIMIYYITLVWMLSKCSGSGLVFNEDEIERLIVADAQHAPAMIGKQIPDSKKGIWVNPAMGDHIRTELGEASIDLVHRVCDEITWALRCASEMPNVHGTDEHPIRTKDLLKSKRIAKSNKFEDRFSKKMFEVGPGSRSAPAQPQGRAGRSSAFVLDS